MGATGIMLLPNHPISLVYCDCIATTDDVGISRNRFGFAGMLATEFHQSEESTYFLLIDVDWSEIANPSFLLNPDDSSNIYITVNYVTVYVTVRSRLSRARNGGVGI